MSAKGGVAQRLLDAERSAAALASENTELKAKLERQRKALADTKRGLEDTKREAQSARKETRHLVQRLGNVERAATSRALRPDEQVEYWSEEAGRRFAAQQEELATLREQNEALRQRLDAFALEQQPMMLPTGPLAPSAAGRQAGGAAAPAAPLGSFPSQPVWGLQEFSTGGSAYLLDPRTGKLYTHAAEGKWPKPVGKRQPTRGPPRLNRPFTCY